MFEHVYLNIRPRADSDWKQSKPRADPDRTQKRTPRANPNFRSGPVKKTRGLLYVTGLSIRITDKLPWPIGALTNQLPDRVDQSARQRIIQCIFQQHVRVEPMHFIRKKTTIRIHIYLLILTSLSSLKKNAWRLLSLPKKYFHFSYNSWII